MTEVTKAAGDSRATEGEGGNGMRAAQHKFMGIDPIRPDGKAARGFWFVCLKCGFPKKGPHRRRGMRHRAPNGLECNGEFEVKLFRGNPKIPTPLRQLDKPRWGWRNPLRLMQKRSVRLTRQARRTQRRAG